MGLTDEPNIDTLREISFQTFVRAAIFALTNGGAHSLDEISDEKIKTVAHEITRNQADGPIKIIADDLANEVIGKKKNLPDLYENMRELAEAAFAVITRDGTHPLNDIKEERVENLAREWSQRYQVDKEELLDAIEKIIE